MGPSGALDLAQQAIKAGGIAQMPVLFAISCREVRLYRGTIIVDVNLGFQCHEVEVGSGIPAKLFWMPEPISIEIPT